MDNQNKNGTKKRIDLGSLYPTPKTYDEIQEQHARREARMLARQPKYVPFMTSIGMSIAVLLFVLIVSNISFFLILGVVSGVFGAFLVGLMWFAFTAWQAKQLSEFFQQKGYSPMPFYAAYSISALSLLSAIYELLIASMPLVLVAVILASINILLINLLASVVVAKGLQNSYKISALVAVAVISIVIAVYTAIAS